MNIHPTFRPEMTPNPQSTQMQKIEKKLVEKFDLKKLKIASKRVVRNLKDALSKNSF